MTERKIEESTDIYARLLHTVDELEREHEAVREEMAQVIKLRDEAQAHVYREEELQRQLQKELSEAYVDIATAKNALIAREATRAEELHAQGIFSSLSSSMTSNKTDTDETQLERETRIRERQEALEIGFEQERQRSNAFKASLRAYESRIEAEAKLAARKATLGEDKQA